MYDCLFSIYNNKRALRKLASATETKKGKDKIKYPQLVSLLERIDWKRLYQFLVFLKPFKVARLRLCAQSSPTIHKCVPYAMHLLRRIQTCPLFHHSRIYLSGIWRAKVIDRLSDIHRIAAHLSPFTLWKLQRAEVEPYTKSDRALVVSKLLEYEFSHSNPADDGESFSETKCYVTKKNNKRSKIDHMALGDFNFGEDDIKEKNERTLVDEFNHYMDNLGSICVSLKREILLEDSKIDNFDDILNIWLHLRPEYPKLFDYVQLVLCAQSTNLSIESIFSETNLVLTSRNSHMKPETLEARVFVQRNADLFVPDVFEDLQMPNSPMESKILEQLGHYEQFNKDQTADDFDRTQAVPKFREDDEYYYETDDDSSDDDSQTTEIDEDWMYQFDYNHSEEEDDEEEY